MWNEIYNNIFYNTCAIDNNLVDYLIEKIKFNTSYEIKDEDYKSIINKTVFRYYRSKYIIYQDNFAMDCIEKLINQAKEFTKLDFNKKSIYKPFQLTTKYFNKNSSYGLHFENPTYFGDYFFVLYLDDCVGGELVFPDSNDIDILFDSRIESKHEWNKGVAHLHDYGYSPLIVDKTFSIQPKRNTAILGKIPYAHYVNKIQSDNGRIVVNGFPFAK